MTLKTLLGAASALALLSGVAVAQQADSAAGATDQTMTPPAASATDAMGAAQDQAESATGAETTPPATDSDSSMTQAPATDSGADDTTAESTETTPPAMESDTAESATGSDTMTEPDATMAAPDTSTTTTDTTTVTDQATAAPSGEPVAASDLMGKDVVGRDGEDIGTVSDLVVDSKSGEIQQVVIKSGGFLGLGGKKVAVDRDQIEIIPNQGVQADIAKADVETMPEWDDDSVASLDEAPATPATGGTPGMPAPAAPQ